MRTRDLVRTLNTPVRLRVGCFTTLALLMLLPSLAATGQGPVVTYYPTFGAVTPGSPGYDAEGHAFAEYWYSGASTFNLSETPQQVVAEEVLGEWLEPAALAQCLSPRVLAPGEGSLTSCEFHGAIRFVKLRHNPEVVLGSQVTRYRVAPCETSVQHHLPQGFAPLPTYNRLFQAGERTLAGPVELRTQGFPPDCATANQIYNRRVNVTLANYGQTLATFTIVAYRFRRYHAGYDPVWTSAVTVGARSVHQVNDIPIPRTLTDPGENRLAGSMSVWLTITSDQPYLGYVSSVFEGGEPGSLPFQVFPLRGAEPPPSSP